MEIFEQCHVINDLLNSGNETKARAELVKMLDALKLTNTPYNELINNLIRKVGLFPYLEQGTSSWQERFVYEAFKANVGHSTDVTLHREQSRLLGKLLKGESVAVSAPTSFGKSFVIDAFISISRPSTVLILVPTIALADETRRRLHQKFSDTYRVITTTDEELTRKSILIFPQERVASYFEQLKNIDLFIVDEFYKASYSFDKERSPALVRAIFELSKISKQRYFLAPNISALKGNAFTEGMEFLHLDFNTVYLDKVDYSNEISKNKTLKSKYFLRIIGNSEKKTLVYAGTYSNIRTLSTLLIENVKPKNISLLNNCSSWLAKHYDPDWELTKLLTRGIGIHNGRLHRSLSQIQLRLFDEDNGIDTIVSTSSIIEGVNTSAEIVILWSNRIGNRALDDFTYKNIMGRGGRMFRHFVGIIYILEPPPKETNTQLEIELPDELLGTIDEDDLHFPLSPGQKNTLDTFKSKMHSVVGIHLAAKLLSSSRLKTCDSKLILKIATELTQNKSEWKGLGFLNSNDPSQWEHYLYKLIKLDPGKWGIRYGSYVAFVKVLLKNWDLPIPDLISQLKEHNIGLEEFFELERNTTFKLASFLSDVAIIYNTIYSSEIINLSVAISRLSHAFLPEQVYKLEEYGLPRMLSRKIHLSGMINLENPSHTLHDTLTEFNTVGFDALREAIDDFDQFDIFILKYFYDGIGMSKSSSTIVDI